VMTEIDDMLACFVSADADADEGDLKRVIQKAQEFIRERFRIQFTAAISRLYDGIDNVTIAYHDASEAMEYRMLIGSGAVISASEVRVDNQDYFFTLEKELRIIQLIKTGDYEQAKEMI